jgi:hypothetical protein
VAAETGGSGLIRDLKADREKPVHGPQNRLCWFLDCLGEKFGNCFKFRAQGTDFCRIIPPRYFGRAGILPIAIETDFISHHNFTGILAHLRQYSYPRSVKHPYRKTQRRGLAKAVEFPEPAQVQAIAEEGVLCVSQDGETPASPCVLRERA